MDVFTLTDSELAANLHALREELRRRASLTPSADPFQIIKANEPAKRALAIAAAGDHTICFIGPRGSGKTMLRAAAAALDVPSFELHPCPCGNYSDPRAICDCTPEEIRSHRRAGPHADITVDAYLVTPRELYSHVPGTTLETIRRWIDSRANHTGCAMDVYSDTLLKNARDELGMSTRAIAAAVRVARTIANMDDSQTILSQHMAEAINYRPGF